MRDKIYKIIFEADTRLGKLFDVVLIWFILISVLIVCLESVEEYREKLGLTFLVVEWIFTIFFTIEYILRVISIDKPARYIFSFYGMVDLLAIVPVYIGIFVSGAQSLLVIRAVRILRVFRLFKLSRYVGEAEVLKKAMIASKQKITIFLLVILTIVIFMGAVMYLIEGEENGFNSIPKSMYWAIVTMTTVGYGDLVPNTDLGKFLASVLMIMGYGIIAVPTGIVTAELTNASQPNLVKVCNKCQKNIIRTDFNFCPNCGNNLGTSPS